MAGAIRTAEIVAVGSELLTPHRIDTNSLYLTARLNDLGIRVRAKGVVPDDRDALSDWVRGAMARADLVVVTGGLGPTEDDVTREAVSAVLGRTLREDETIVESIRARFARRHLEMPEVNRRQAMVPEGAVMFVNANGTAPGLWLEAGDRVVVLLPGPRRELEAMFERDVAPRLAGRTDGTPLHRRILKIVGWPESHVETVAQPIYSRLGGGAVAVDTTILASPGLIELHLEGRGADAKTIDDVLDAGAEALAAALGDDVFTTTGAAIEEVVGELLKARGWRIAAAESCTAGLLLARLTEVAGSSVWVLGGVVAYDNAVKTSTLGVPMHDLQTHGAVSEPVARAMASGVRARLGADIGVAVTGIAGPGGGSEAKPVGTVVVAVSGPVEQVRTFRFTGNRAAVRTQSVLAALNMVRRAALSRN